MRYFVILCGLGSLACFTGQYASYRIRNTPEGAECARQCVIVRNTCLSANERKLGAEDHCDKQMQDCRSTCPGAERI
jgi:hypothetical protein